MNMLDTIKNMRNEFRKQPDKAAEVSILTTLVGELETDSTRSRKETTDAEVVTKVRKFVNSNNEVIAVLTKRGDQTPETLVKENALLSQFLPVLYTEQQLTDILTDVVFTNVGEAQKYLAMNHKGKYDAKMAAAVAQSIIAQ